MGKGCDVVFKIDDSIIRIETDLSHDQINLNTISELLMNKNTYQLQELQEQLKYATSVKEVTREQIEKEGIINNATVYNISDLYDDISFEGLDQSTKLLLIKKFKYYNTDLSDKIIYNNGQKIFVVNPDNKFEVFKLRDHLKLKADINDEDFSDSELNEIFEKDLLSSKINSFKQAYERAKKDKPKEIDVRLGSKYEKFKEFTPSNLKELILDYSENKSKYSGITLTIKGKNVGLTSTLNTIISRILNKPYIKEATYQDVFANEIILRSRWDSEQNKSYITVSNLVEALTVKLDDLKSKRSGLSEKEFKQNEILSNQIEKYINKPDNKKVSELFDLLVKSSDDEFSKQIFKIIGNRIYLDNTYNTVQQQFSDFCYDTIKVYKPLPTYKGFTIYQDRDFHNSTVYYITRHILTPDSIVGRRYFTIESAKKAIDERVDKASISSHTLIEFKFIPSDGELTTAYSINKFLPRQVVKVLDIPLKQNLYLNEFERNLIYNDGYTLEDFYSYFDKYISSKQGKQDLRKYIDTFEKASVFVYKINELLNSEQEIAREQVIRKQIPDAVFNNILDEIKTAQYVYYEIEQVYDKKFLNYNKRNTYHVNGIEKQQFKYRVNKINVSSEFNSLEQKVKTKYGQLVPNIRLMETLADKIKAKTGVEIHLLTQSDIEGLSDEIDNSVKAFIKNGEIYVNVSNASETDLIHEYAHIMLGVLKGINFDNYSTLLESVISKLSGSTIERYRKRYGNIAQSDLYEEIFVDMFAHNMLGKDYGTFINRELSTVKEEVKHGMNVIFGSKKISDDFLNKEIKDIFKEFSSELANYTFTNTNGLEVGTSYRRAANWIAEQMKDGSITENCD